MEIKGANKSSVIYSTDSGLPSSYNTWSGRKISYEEFRDYLDVVTSTDGSLRQIWNMWDGLANIENITADGYTIALYLPRQVGMKDAESGLYAVTGEPFKTFEIGTNEERTRLVVTERVTGREPYVTSWWQTGEAWSMSRGTGEDEIITFREREELGDNKYRIITTIKRGMNGEAVSCTSETFTKTDEGTLRNDKTVAYGSSSSAKISYSYDSAGRGNSISPNYSIKGAVRQSGYDTHNRPSVSYEPWAGGTHRVAYTYYKDGDFYDSDIDYQRIALIKDGNATQYQRITYTYFTASHVRRVEKRMTALGSDKTQLEIKETWLGTAPNPHAQGRIKMEQGIDGIQTHYTYEEDFSYGSLYRQTAEIRVEGELIPGKSTRSVTYVSEQGNDMRIEDYALLLDGTWSLLDTVDYEYDRENRWIKRTRSNGRVSEREMMCCGPLWERDEDGVLTTYSYNTARQLVEVIRAATDTIPETITSYQRDAMDRILEKRVDIGPMTTITKTSYDLQGRIISYTDELGRVTSYSYSEDGLTRTIISPTGSSLVTKIHPDGTILEESGTGQRHLIHNVEATKNGIRTTVSTLSTDGKNFIFLSRKTVNGFGQTVSEEVPNTDGEWIATHYRYNEKGQKVQRQTGNLAPILYSYDVMGVLEKEIVKLDGEPTPLNSRITEWTSSYEKREDGIYWKEVTKAYSSTGTPIETAQLKLETLLHPLLEEKTITVDARGSETVEWTEYGEPGQRIRKIKKPESDIIEECILSDGILAHFKDCTGIVSHYTCHFNESGKRVTRTDARNNTVTVEQDISGRTVKEIDAVGNTTITAYDIATGLPAVVTDALGHTVCYSYDGRGRKIGEYGTGIQPALYAYDDADNLVSLTTFRALKETIDSDPADRMDGDTTVWHYDTATGLLLSKTYADGTSENYSYDALNRLEYSIDARSITAQRTYAFLTGELVSIIFDDETTTKTPSITYAYNHLGMVVSITDGSGMRTFDYNQYNELESETTDGLVGSTLTNSFDALGRAGGYSLAYGGENVQTVTTAYDTKGRMGSAGMNSIEMPFTYGYNAINGLLETLRYPNTMTRWYTYEHKRNLVTKVDYLRPGSTNYPAKVDYAYDALARPTSKKDYFNTPNPSLTHTYSYNDRSELTSDVMTRGGIYGYGYDNIGNRKTSQEGAGAPATVYMANDLNQYASIVEDGETSFIPIYDMDGNQTKVKTSSGEWSVTYNGLNQAILFAQGSKRVECLYDYLNRRVEKAVYEGEILVSKKRFIYRGYQQIAELDASSIKRQVEPVLRKTYLWDPAESAATRILAMTVFNGSGSYVEDLYYMHDALKNTIALFGIQAGRRALYEFGPYGAIIKMEGNAAEENPFRFSSEYYDDELGLVYYNYRYYNPQQGTWLSREPVGEQGGNNLYGMVNNRISSRVDYLGLIPMEMGEYMAGKSIGFSNLSNQEKQQAREAIGNTPSAQEVADMAQEIVDTSQDHLDDLQTALDAVGVIDPTPACDLTNALIHCCRGNWMDIGISLAGCVPYFGDSLKGIKYGAKLGKGGKTEKALKETEKNLAKGIREKDLGPSGKPKIHNKDLSSKKEAKEAAQHEGKGNPMHHPNPTVGSPHYHATDKDGKKIPGTHYNYDETNYILLWRISAFQKHGA